MLVHRKLLDRYIIGAIAPYLLLSLTLLSGAILAQQTTRFIEIFGNAHAPSRLFFDALLDLFPNILVFAIPTATLVGTIIGLARMNGDSELVALKSAGISRYRIAALPVFLGLCLCIVTFVLSFKVAPAAARDLRRIGIVAALQKFESPVDPGSFFTDSPGKVLFVREGMKESGQWGRVFMHWMEPDGVLRLVTARSGRIDSSGGQSELVLDDAEVVTIPKLVHVGEGEGKQITSERSSTFRMKDERLDSGKTDLLRLLKDREISPEEMGWTELRTGIQAENGPRKVNLISIFQRRMALCLAPLVFSFFGAAVGLSAVRGGRGSGMVISIIVLLIYYLLTVGGDNLGRGGVIPQVIGSWIANGVILCISLIIFAGEGGCLSGAIWKTAQVTRIFKTNRSIPRRIKSLKSRLNWGLMDRYLLRSLLGNFAVGFTLLVLVFLIFTLFDLLRFVSVREGNWQLIFRYLFFMIPFASIAMAPMGVLVAVLGGYALMARRSEAVAWWASGRSVFRLAIPGLLFAFGIGAIFLLIQEEILPQSNRIQNNLRARIRGGAQEVGGGPQWLASSDQKVIYTYTYDYKSDQLVNPTIFYFDSEGVHLSQIAFGGRGDLEGKPSLRINDATIISIAGGDVELIRKEVSDSNTPPELFKPTLKNPAEMNIRQLSDSLNDLGGRKDLADVAILMLIEVKRVAPFSPFVLALVGMPLALKFGRKSAITALCCAILIGLGFWVMRSVFFYFGSKGLLPVSIAAWTPGTSFAALGIYLLTRART